MHPSTLVTTPAETALPVRWEPCVEAEPTEPGAGFCRGCGWPLDDHSPADPFVTAEAA